MLKCSEFSGIFWIICYAIVDTSVLPFKSPINNFHVHVQYPYTQLILSWCVIDLLYNCAKILKKFKPHNHANNSLYGNIGMVGVLRNLNCAMACQYQYLSNFETFLYLEHEVRRLKTTI